MGHSTDAMNKRNLRSAQKSVTGEIPIQEDGPATNVDPLALGIFLELTLATAQAGLTFSKDPFDIERFRTLQRAAAEFISRQEKLPADVVEGWINLDVQYPTPKLDVRAFILDRRQQVLLVQEASDRAWTLPGGWCDINESPGEAVVREVREETGLDVKPTRLLALLDKHKHPHPPQVPHALKAFFLCEMTGGSLLTKTNETLAAGYYPPHSLPSLSEHRVLASQIRMLHDRAVNGCVESVFD